MRPRSTPRVFSKSVFREAFDKTRQLLDHPKVDDLQASTWTLQGRNKVLDETAETYAKAADAECRTGCVSCCYLMVSGAPVEGLSIARHMLETRTPAEIEAQEQMQKVAEVPLDAALRVKASIPCALLENGRCSAYEQRPSVGRMMLSQSRAGCDSCLQGAGGSMPYSSTPQRLPQSCKWASIVRSSRGGTCGSKEPNSVAPGWWFSTTSKKCRRSGSR